MGICGIVEREPQEGSQMEWGLKLGGKTSQGSLQKPPSPVEFSLRSRFTSPFLSSKQEEQIQAGWQALHDQEILCLLWDTFSMSWTRKQFARCARTAGWGFGREEPRHAVCERLLKASLWECSSCSKLLHLPRGEPGLLRNSALIGFGGLDFFRVRP